MPSVASAEKEGTMTHARREKKKKKTGKIKKTNPGRELITITDPTRPN